MIRQSAEEVRSRAEALVARAPEVRAEIVRGESLIGGGATPEQPIPTWLIAIDCDAAEAERRLRSVDPPVIARIERGRILLDLRTVFRAEENELADALRGLCAREAERR